MSCTTMFAATGAEEQASAPLNRMGPYAAAPCHFYLAPTRPKRTSESGFQMVRNRPRADFRCVRGQMPISFPRRNLHGLIV